MTTSASERPEATAPSLQPATAPVELTAEELQFRVSLGVDFQTTAELAPGRDFIGQERARAALELGLGVASSGFNIFVSGLTGAHKLESLRDWLALQAAQASTPEDWLYVQNFAHPDEPLAI